MKGLAVLENGFYGTLPTVHRPDPKILESIQNQVRTGIKPGQYEGYSIISIDEDTPYGCKVKFSVKTRTDKGVDVVVYTQYFDKK